MFTVPFLGGKIENHINELKKTNVMQAKLPKLRFQWNFEYSVHK